MNSIRELWYGNIHPQEDGIYNKPELKELIGYMARRHEALENVLNNEQKDLLEKYTDCRNEFELLGEVAVFEYGFRLGAQLMLQMLQGME